jgi:hypothetical protein
MAFEETARWAMPLWLISSKTPQKWNRFGDELQFQKLCPGKIYFSSGQ